MTALLLSLFAAFLQAASDPAAPRRVTPGAAAAVEPAYREVKPGEQRVAGSLLRVDCPPRRPVTFVLKAEDRVAKYQAPRLDAVEYIAHTPDFKGPMVCGGRMPGDPVLLTWKSLGKIRQAVAIEFLPRK